jgi:peptidyl-tRNA hydrolase
VSLYAVVRNDIGMSPGKCASQAGHAYLGAFLTAQQLSPTTAGLYAADLPGTKVCLQAALHHLLRAKAELEQAGIPTYMVVDSGCANFFDGRPTITALGFGPAAKSELPKFISRLQLL